MNFFKIPKTSLTQINAAFWSLRLKKHLTANVS